MFRLRTRTVDDCDLVVSWVPNADALYLFTGARLRWPLNTVQLADMEQMVGFSAWMLVEESTGHPIGHFDLSIDDATARLGRVLVDPARRGLGLAHVLIGLAIDEARLLGVSELRLNVIAGNEPAVRAYARAGFSRLPTSERPDVQAMSLAL